MVMEINVLNGSQEMEIVAPSLDFFTTKVPLWCVMTLDTVSQPPVSIALA